MECDRKRRVPPCHQCQVADSPCYRKTWGPGCWRCYQQKIGCSMVEKKKKGKETEERSGKVEETIMVKRGGRTKKAETDKLTEVLERMAESMERIADGDRKSVV